jgi:hypothetical protein
MRNFMHSIKYSVQHSTKQAISKATKTINCEITTKTNIAFINNPINYITKKYAIITKILKEKIHQWYHKEKHYLSHSCKRQEIRKLHNNGKWIYILKCGGDMYFQTEILYQLYEIFRSYSNIVLFKFLQVCEDSEASDEGSKLVILNETVTELKICNAALNMSFDSQIDNCKVVCVTTDGTPSTPSTPSRGGGCITLYINPVSYLIVLLHCTVHEEALCAT